MGVFLPEWACLLRSKNNRNFSKTCFLKQGYVQMSKYAQIYYIKSVYCMVQHIYIILLTLVYINTYNTYNTYNTAITFSK